MSHFNTILLGPVGTGKTTSLRTIPRAGHDLFVLATEPGIDNILTHGEDRNGGGQTHWRTIPCATADWDTMKKNAILLNTIPMDQLMKGSGNRQDYRQFIEIYGACANFECEICGRGFGPVDHLDPSAVFAIDGMSGLSVMSMDLVAGGKPVKSQQDWGAAMDNLERFLTKCCADLTCSFVLIAHVDREIDEITGGTKVMVSTLGRKLAPKIPRFFDEVIYCRKQGDKFFWSTTESNIDLKARRLPFRDDIRPDFAPLLKDQQSK